MDKLLRVDMSELKVSVEPIRGKYARLGGRALTSSIIDQEVPPPCHPLGKYNKIVFAPGLLGGTAAACSGRLSVGAKSPLTGTIKESNAGGTAAQKMARLGIAAIVVEGIPKRNKTYVLKVTKKGAELQSAPSLRGLGNYDTVARLFRRHGKKVSCISIGQAGEMKMSAASVAVTDMENRPTRHAGRGGLGAVMGSKGLKAIVIDDAGGTRPSIKNRKAFTAAARKFAKALKEHPVTGVGLPTYGTNVLTNVINEAGAYPTRNFTEGQFEGASKISGERQRDIIIKRGGVPQHACHPGCTIQCSRIYVDKDGHYITKGPEYETVWANGANCGIDNLDAIARLDRLYDDYGVDTIEMGATLGVVMASGHEKFGDWRAAIRMIKEVGKGSPLGRVLGNGAAVAGQVFGVAEVPVVKRQAMPAYDPRAVKGIGVTYATSPMGADHTAGYAVAPNILGVGGRVDPLKAKGQVEISRTLQISTAAIDTAGLCLFVAFAALDKPEASEAMYEMLNAQYGWRLTAEALAGLGQRVLGIERDFNQRAGLTKEDDRLPYYFQKEKLPPHNVVFDVPDKELDQVFNF